MGDQQRFCDASDILLPLQHDSSEPKSQDWHWNQPHLDPQEGAEFKD
jgi:hypothetical protein